MASELGSVQVQEWDRGLPVKVETLSSEAANLEIPKQLHVVESLGDRECTVPGSAELERTSGAGSRR